MSTLSDLKWVAIAGAVGIVGIVALRVFRTGERVVDAVKGTATDAVEGAQSVLNKAQVAFDGAVQKGRDVLLPAPKETFNDRRYETEREAGVNEWDLPGASRENIVVPLEPAYDPSIVGYPSAFVGYPPAYIEFGAGREGTYPAQFGPSDVQYALNLSDGGAT